MKKIGFCDRFSRLAKPFDEQREAYYISGPQLSGRKIVELIAFRDTSSNISLEPEAVHISIAAPETYEFSATLSTRFAVGIIYTHFVDKKRPNDPDAIVSQQYMMPSPIKSMIEVIGCDVKFRPFQLKDEAQAASVADWMYKLLVDFRDSYFDEFGGR